MPSGNTNKQERQLTLRAVLVGGVLGMLMSISNLYTTVKLGWAFGVAITASVISFSSWRTLRALTFGRISNLSILETNCMQSTASAAGYSTGSTVGTACGALLLLTGEHLSVPVLLLFVLLTALLGVFIAIPMKYQMINVEKLAFPSGIAAAETLKSLYGRGSEGVHKAYALMTALNVGALFGVLRTEAGMFSWLDRLHHATGNWLRIPSLLPFPGSVLGFSRGHVVGFGFEPSLLLIGAGVIVGLRVALSMLAGGVILFFIASPLLLAHDARMSDAQDFVPSLPIHASGTIMPTHWGLWAGCALIVVSSLTTVLLDFRSIARAFRPSRRMMHHAHQRASDEVPLSWFLIGVVPLSIAIVVLNYFAFDMNVLLSLVAIILAFVLSLVTCRAVGETDTAPVGPMGKVTQLVYAVLAKGNTTINVMGAGTTSCAAASAADLLTDLKSGYLLGANPRKQFLAQFIGVFFGTVAIVPAWLLMFPTAASLEAYQPPATNMWKAIAIALTKGLASVPQTAQWAMLIAGILGIILPAIAFFWPKLQPYLPSAMGLGLGFIMPFYNSLAFAIGAIIGAIWLAVARKNAEAYAIPMASGLVAGESLAAALLAIAAALPAVFLRYI